MGQYFYSIIVLAVEAVHLASLVYSIIVLAVEAVHLANLLCQFGYYFPVNEQKNLLVKDDSSLYRFQVINLLLEFLNSFL